MLNKNINKNQKKPFLQKLFALLFLFLLVSCEDHGCYDADDFGEYESYTFKVESSRLGEYCTYKDGFADVDQPFGIKECIIDCPVSSSINKTSCAQGCEDKCRLNATATLDSISRQQSADASQSSVSTPPKRTSEPLWTSVGGGGKEITIEHNSKILVNAQGTIDLGSEVQKSIVFINQIDTGKENWNDLTASSNLNLAKFSGKENATVTIEGKFTDASNIYFNSRDTPVNPDSPTYDSTLDSNLVNYYEKSIANGARRIFAYFIPFPSVGKYYSNKFPLAPDPSSWQCSVDAQYLRCSANDSCTDIDKSKCDLYGKDITSFSTQKDREEYDFYFSKIFNVDNLTQATSRYNGGTGFIRYKGDNLNGPNSDSRLYYKKLDVSNLGRRLSFPNNQKDYAIKFKNGVNSCNNFKYKIDYNNNLVVDYSVSFGSEATYIINKKDLGSVFYQADQNCEVEVFFYPFHEIEFSESGYIEFGIPNQSFPPGSLTNCALKFKIFNKDEAKDEFANFRYPTSSSAVNYREAVETVNATHSMIIDGVNNPKKYFIRKGQILSFHPDSWNGTWIPRGAGVNSNNIEQQCGVGFYVKLTPRPAVFCSDKVVKEFIDINHDNNANNNCNNLFYDKNINQYTGCLEDAASCTGANFCPSECIPKNFSSCRASTTSPLSPINLFRSSSAQSCNPIEPDKICYDSVAAIIPPECPNPSKCITYQDLLNINPYKSMQLIPAGVEASCAKCRNELKEQAIKPFYTLTEAGLQQCYDLESYTGTMEELKNKLNVLTSDDKSLEAYKIFEDLKAKGLKKLETFDGNYGNFYPLENTTKKNFDNLPIYKIKKLASVGRAGYLKFIILDDIPTNAVNPDYFEISSNRANISITSPLRVNIKSNNELSNGEGLTIALCEEGQAGSENCSNNRTLYNQKSTFPIFEAVLPIAEHSSADASESSNYAFNDFGQLIRTSEINSLITSENRYRRECTAKNDIKPYTGANFLCFNDYTNDSKDLSLSNRYRLTFKIFDNETPSCKVGGSSYEDCIPSLENNQGCNKYKVVNKNWNGDLQNAGYCTDTETICTKKYRCYEDKYANNEGHYDVAVKIKRESKVKISSFIDSIISPILGQVDGFYKTDKVDYELNPAFIDAVAMNTSNGNAEKTVINDETLKRDLANIGEDDEFVTIDSLASKSLELEANKKTSCSSSCFISYIVKAVLIFKNGCEAPRSFKANADSSCKGSTKCSFLVSGDFIKYSNGEGIATPSISGCKIEKAFIQYVYSKSEKPLYKENQVRRIYKSILINPVYKSFLTLSIVLMLSFYGMGFLMGVSELKQSEIIDRLIKIAIIYLFTNPEFGWVWFEKFFVTFFKNGVDFLTFTMAGLFDEGNQIDSALKTGNFSNKSLIFAGVDRVVQLFLINDVVHKKIGALMFYNFFGILYVMIIYYSAIAYVYAVSNAVLIYLTSQFFTSVLFIVGPIFFVFILFKQTRGFFDNWLNALIGFGLQQIFLVFTLSLFNTMLYLVIKLTLGFRVCWDSVWHINLPGGINLSLLSFWTPQDSPPYLGELSHPSAEGSTAGIPTIPRLLSLWTICVIMKSFITTITDLAASLSGGMSATELGSSVAKGMNSMIAQTQEKFGDLYKKSGARVMERVDQRLFDSGDLAKQARQKAKNANSHDNKLKEKMIKDGDKAVSNYKAENSNEYSKMTEAQKRGKLNEVKKEAMKDSAKSMGKTDKEVEALMKDKSGSKYQGDNVFGAMISIGKDRFKSGSFARKSLNEKALDFDTGMSKKEMNKAMKDMGNSDKREAFIDNVKNGNIKESPGLMERLNPFNIRGEMKEKAEERQIAINQLEKSGDIPTLASTFDPKNPKRNLPEKAAFVLKNPIESSIAAFSERSESAEEKILTRIKENREQPRIKENSFGGGREVNPKNIKRLEAFANYLEVKEGKNSKEDQLKAKKELLNALHPSPTPLQQPAGAPPVPPPPQQPAGPPPAPPPPQQPAGVA